MYLNTETVTKEFLNHWAVEIFIDMPLQQNIPITSSRYQFVDTDIDTFQNTMAEVFNSNLHLPQKLLTWMNIKNIDRVKINKDTLKLIKEKVNSDNSMPNKKLPSAKSSISKLQKEIYQKLNKERNTRWEKFCNSISL